MVFTTGAAMTDLTPVVIDYETYYAKDYNLKKLPTVLYVRDPRFHVHGVSIKVGDGPTQWFRDVDVATALNRLNWPQVCLIGHNLYFDAMILVEHYGHRPARYFDTLFAAKMLMPAGVRHDLDTVARALGLSGKIQGTLASLMGVRHLTDEQHTALGIYGNADVDQTYGVYNRLLPLVPEEERYVFHMTTRMGVDSPIRLDQNILREEIDLAKAQRAARIDENGFDLDTLTSNDKFLNLLKTLVPEGELPFKQNAKNQTIPALGKTDAQWVRFKLDHPELQALCEAREAAKSNIMLRRPELYLQIAQTSRGTLPMAYNAWGAHTGRFSGRDRLNVQNMPNLHRSKLRLALVAPPERVIHVADSSQIELRLQLWFSGQLDILEELANGGDPYSRVASAIYKRPITKANKLERGVGKATELGCQYGMGPPKFRQYMAGGPLGLDPIFFSETEAQNAVAGYRATHPMTITMWETLNRMIPLMAQSNCNVELGPVTFRHEHILLPNGTCLDYTGLRPTEEGGWAYGVNGLTKYLWGGTLLENIVQALARVVVVDQAVIIDREIAPVIGWTHDENLVLGHENGAEERQKAIEEVMKQRPHWAPDLPLDAEGGFDRAYSK